MKTRLRKAKLRQNGCVEDIDFRHPRGLDNFLEILEDRHNFKSTFVISQLPIEHWHEQIGDPTLADAILDRLVHSAHKINLKGESMRKKKENLI